MDGYPKTAACACGALTVTVTAPPKKVHACSCLSCQRRSGSAFTYTAFFAEGDVAVSGEWKAWRRGSEAGRFHETNFCPTCGCAVFYRLEALPGVIAVPVGSFADPAFAKPDKLYWTAHRHQWLTPLGDVVWVERQ
jgi:hypothetical protein